MIVSLETLSRITGRAENSNARSLAGGLARRGAAVGLDRPHRLAHFLAQVLHESGGFRFDREIWGPTPAQVRYEDRADLGHSPEVDGEAERFKGRGPIQLTGRANYRAFTEWAQRFAPDAPDFEVNPDAVVSDPWEGLAPLWYWEDRDVNRFADRGNLEQVTRAINGGVNGFNDRKRWYARAALGLLGRDPDDVRGFQARAGLRADGDPGPATRAALHAALERLPALAEEGVRPRSRPSTCPSLDPTLPPLGALEARSTIAAAIFVLTSIAHYVGIDVGASLEVAGLPAAPEALADQAISAFNKVSAIWFALERINPARRIVWRVRR